MFHVHFIFNKSCKWIGVKYITLEQFINFSLYFFKRYAIFASILATFPPICWCMDTWMMLNWKGCVCVCVFEAWRLWAEKSTLCLYINALNDQLEDLAILWYFFNDNFSWFKSLRMQLSHTHSKQEIIKTHP